MIMNGDSTDDETEVIEVSSQSRPTSANEALSLQVESSGEGLPEPGLGSDRIDEHQSTPVSIDAALNDNNRPGGLVSHSAVSDNSLGDGQENFWDYHGNSINSDAKVKKSKLPSASPSKGNDRRRSSRWESNTSTDPFGRTTSDTSPKADTTGTFAVGSADQKPTLTSSTGSRTDLTGSDSADSVTSMQDSEDVDQPTPTTGSVPVEFTCVHDYVMLPEMEKTRSAIREVEVLISRGSMTPPTTPASNSWNQFWERLEQLCRHATVIWGQTPVTVFRSVSLAHDLALWVWVALNSEPMLLVAVDMLESSTTVDCPSCTSTNQLYSDAFESAAAFVMLLVRASGTDSTDTESLTKAERNTFATHLRNIVIRLAPIVSCAPVSVRTSGILWTCAVVSRKWEAALARLEETITSIRTTLTTANRTREFVVTEWAQAFELAVVSNNFLGAMGGKEEMGTTEAFRRCMKLKRGLRSKMDVFELRDCFVPERCLNFDEKCKPQKHSVLAKIPELFKILISCFPENPVGTLITRPNFSVPGLIDGFLYHPMACPIGRNWVDKAMQFRMYYLTFQNPGPNAREKLLECLRTTFRVHFLLFRQKPPPQKHHSPASCMFLEFDMMRDVHRIVKDRAGPVLGPGVAAERSAARFIELDLRSMTLDLCLLLLARFWTEPKVSIYMASTIENRKSAVGLEFVDDLLAGLSHLCPSEVRVRMGYSLAMGKLVRSPTVMLPEDVLLNVGGIEKMKSDFFSAGFKVVPPSQAIEDFLDVWLRRALQMGELIRNCARFCISNKSKDTLQALEKEFLAFCIVKLTEICEDCAKTSDAVPEGRVFNVKETMNLTKLFQLFPFASDHRVLRFCLRNVSSFMRLLCPLSREILDLATRHIHQYSHFELLRTLELALRRIEKKLAEMQSTDALLSRASQTVANPAEQHAPFWAITVEEFAAFVIDRSLSNLSTVARTTASNNFVRWLQETSKIRSEMSVIETHVVARKMELENAAVVDNALDQLDCRKILDLARRTLCVLTLTIPRSGKAPGSKYDDKLTRFASAIPAGALLEMCICDAKEILGLAVDVLSRFSSRALTPENVEKLASLISDSNNSTLDDTLDAKFRGNLTTVSKSWDSLVKFGDPPRPAAALMRQVVVKAVTNEKTAAPMVVMHPACPPPPVPTSTKTLASAPLYYRPNPAPPSSVPNGFDPVPLSNGPEPLYASPIPVPQAAVSPTIIAPTSDRTSVSFQILNSSGKKRKARWSDATEVVKIPPPTITEVHALSRVPCTSQANEDKNDAVPLAKIPHLDDGFTSYEHYFKTFKSLDARKAEIAVKIEDSQNLTDELMALIGQKQSEPLEDALKRMAEGVSLAETVNWCFLTKHNKRLEVLGVQAVELFEREKHVFDTLAAEKADLRRKLQIFRNLAFQNTRIIAGCSTDELYAVARELRERMQHLRAVVLGRRVGGRAEHDATNLYAILQSDVLRLAETDSESRLLIPDICELFQNEVAPRFLLVQKLHSEMDSKVRKAAALMEACDRRLAELGSSVDQRCF